MYSRKITKNYSHDCFFVIADYLPFNIILCVSYHVIGFFHTINFFLRFNMVLFQSIFYKRRENENNNNKKTFFSSCR